MYQVIVNGSVVAEFDLFTEAEGFAGTHKGAKVVPVLDELEDDLNLEDFEDEFDL